MQSVVLGERTKGDEGYSLGLVGGIVSEDASQLLPGSLVCVGRLLCAER